MLTLELNPILARQGTLIIDGGLATELEWRGHSLDDPLWSARLLLENPQAIADVHHAYLAAGADVIITATYQATLPGLQARGLTADEAADVLRMAVQLAVDVRDAFWAQPANRVNRIRPLVAAGIGPYGAYLANGAEYTGAYDLDAAGLRAFHAARWQILAATAADLLACETLPSWAEARALAGLLAQTPQRAAWFSFCCRNGAQIADGTPIEACAELLDPLPNVVALGINCTAPRFIEPLVGRLTAATHKPIIVYPNSGEIYDAAHNTWLPGTAEPETAFAARAPHWRAAGASLIGGCCRTTPEHVRLVRQQLLG